MIWKSRARRSDLGIGGGPPVRGRRGRLRLGSGALLVWILLPLCGALGCSARVVAGPAEDGARTTLSIERPLMGTLFRIEVVAADQELARTAIEAAFTEVARSEEVLSNWSESSQISMVNRAAASATVAVSSELMTVLDRALLISALTGGAFDVTFASCDDLWSVKERRVPSDSEIAACLPHVDYRNVALDRQGSAVRVLDPAVRIGIAGLAKGYRVDRAAQVLAAHGIVDFVVDGGGDMRVSCGESGTPWKIGVTHPRMPDQALTTVALRSGAVATSGDYQWFFERDGVRYHHIIDPTTGRPARRAVSATVIAATAMDADALATGLFVLGPERGLALAEQLAGVEALIVAPDLSVHASSGFPGAENGRLDIS